MLALSLLLVVMAFHRPVSARLAGNAPPASLALVVHVWSFTAWLVLFGLQATLVARKKLRWHRRIGRILLPLAAVMIWSGAMTQIEGDRLRMEARPELLSFTVVPMSYLAMFGALSVAAWFARRRPEAHKRLMLLALGAIMAGAFIRALGPLLVPIVPDNAFRELTINYGGTLLFAALGVGYDLVTRRRVHPVYLTALPLMVATMIAVLAATKTRWMPDVTRRLITSTRAVEPVGADQVAPLPS